MSRFADFTRAYGDAAPGTGAFDALEPQGLGSDLRDFESEVGSGVFADGFISVMSVRERACKPNPWLAETPEGAIHVATSAFGCLVVAAQGRALVVDILLGNVMHTDLSAGDALLRLAEAETQGELLHRPLFRRWREVTGATLKPDQILVTAPLPVLGGQLALDTITPADASVAMSITHQSYDGRHGERVRTF
jgi:hypothetical protein